MKFNSMGGWEAKKSNLSDADYKQLDEFLIECEFHFGIFNEWENKFITDMRERIEHQLPLTVRQREVIGNLYDKIIRRHR